MRSQPIQRGTRGTPSGTERESENQASTRRARLRGLLVTLTLIVVLALIAIGIVRIVQS